MNQTRRQFGTLGETNATIDYTYDPLYRLTAGDYDNDDYYHYTYDAIGNRLTMDSTQGGVVNYQYDAANRMTSAGGVAYTYDNNGNMLSDGINTYIYDAANRLIAVNGQTNTTYSYGGLGDRHQQNPSTGSGQAVNYTLDLNAGLTQVLSESAPQGYGTNTYLYGNGRISQHTTQTEYFLGDALGSVRQLADTAGAVTLTQGYAPYGEVMQSVGTSQTSYAFTGENRDANGLTYLRARYLDSSVGRFITRDVWPGNLERSLSLNKWIYAEGNPIRYTDPSGYVIRGDERGEIGDIRTNPSTHYQYSCNCGWIDWAHATAEMANYKSTAHDVYNGLTAPIDWSAYSYWSGSWNGSRGVQLVTVMNIKENYVPIVRATAVIQEKTLQNKQLLTPIATGIFMEYSLKVEDFHALSLLNGRNSWYAEEDLPSNMIGFYIATRMRRDNISYEVALQEVQKLCGIMDKKDSLKVFDYDYGGGISFLQGWKRWDARLMPLNCSGADCIEGTRQWPSQFSTLATSASHSGSNGSWHFLSSNSHEMLFPTDTEGVYGVMYVLYGHP